jgi:hypothetical protein
MREPLKIKFTSLCGVAHKKLLLTYAPSTRYCEAAVCGRWRSRSFPHQTALPHRVMTAYAAAQFFARALPSLENWIFGGSLE